MCEKDCIICQIIFLYLVSIYLLSCYPSTWMIIRNVTNTTWEQTFLFLGSRLLNCDMLQYLDLTISVIIKAQLLAKILFKNRLKATPRTFTAAGRLMCAGSRTWYVISASKCAHHPSQVNQWVQAND